MATSFVDGLVLNRKIQICLTLFLVSLSPNAFPQLSKGQYLIGGNAAFSYYKYYSEKVSTISLSPAGGYFFLNRLAGGLRLSYDTHYGVYPSGSRSRVSFISTAPFLRYYFLSTEKKLNFFADAGYGYSWGKFKSFTGRDFSYRSNVISFRAGPAIILNEHTSLEFTLGYNHSILGGISDTLAVNSFQFGVGLQIHIGKRSD